MISRSPQSSRSLTSRCDGPHASIGCRREREGNPRHRGGRSIRPPRSCERIVTRRAETARRLREPPQGASRAVSRRDLAQHRPPRDRHGILDDLIRLSWLRSSKTKARTKPAPGLHEAQMRLPSREMPDCHKPGQPVDPADLAAGETEKVRGGFCRLSSGSQAMPRLKGELKAGSSMCSPSGFNALITAQMS